MSHSITADLIASAMDSLARMPEEIARTTHGPCGDNPSSSHNMAADIARKRTAEATRFLAHLALGFDRPPLVERVDRGAAVRCLWLGREGTWLRAIVAAKSITDMPSRVPVRVALGWLWWGSAKPRPADVHTVTERQPDGSWDTEDRVLREESRPPTQWQLVESYRSDVHTGPMDDVRPVVGRWSDDLGSIRDELLDAVQSSLYAHYHYAASCPAAKDLPAWELYPPHSADTVSAECQAWITAEMTARREAGWHDDVRWP
jgi:hypothetical protein